MPDSVEMPAPVKATTFSASAIIRLSSSTLDMAASWGDLLGGFSVRQECFTERLKQRQVNCVALRIVLRVPLDAQREARRVGDADRLDGAVLRHALDDDARTGLENALAVQRVDADGVAAEELRKDPARHELDVMAIGEDDGG